MELFFDETELITVKSSGSEGEFLSLVDEGFKDFGMTMSLIAASNTANHVEILFAWIRKEIPSTSQRMAP